MKPVREFFTKLAVFFLNYAPLFTLAGLLALELMGGFAK